ncbi:MAG: thioesterase family protein, partial [Proteobacteria bacterium]|nr:thioesterase family protein [Pseudomonadota bacterium]
MGEECTRGGDMEVHQYTGRISDAIPNLMASMQSNEEFALRSSGELGGAVVEIRIDYYNPLTVGSRFVILSGLRSFTQKTMRLSHLVFDLDRDRLVLHSQGIGVALDLKTRRAAAFSDDRIDRMHKRQLTRVAS